MCSRILLFIVFFIFTTNLFAQSKRNLEGIESITHRTFNYNKKGIKRLTIKKESVFDTNKVMIRQNRYNYMKVDTGLATRVHYFFTYNPQTRLGSYYTENLTHESQPKKKYTKQEASFKSFDHKFKREWLKINKKNSKSLAKQTRKTFDENGHVTSTEITNYKHSPPSKSTEKVKRNSSGNIVFWESFDDDGDSKMQARSYQAVYKHDTLLVTSSGYLYHNATEIKNKYDKNGVLKKSITYAGVKASNGKMKRNDQTTVIYKEGKPYKSTEKKLKKLTKSIEYVYEAGREIQKVSTPEKKLRGN